MLRNIFLRSFGAYTFGRFQIIRKCSNITGQKRVNQVTTEVPITKISTHAKLFSTNAPYLQKEE